MWVANSVRRTSASPSVACQTCIPASSGHSCCPSGPTTLQNQYMPHSLGCQDVSSRGAARIPIGFPTAGPTFQPALATPNLERLVALENVHTRTESHDAPKQGCLESSPLRHKVQRARSSCLCGLSLGPRTRGTTSFENDLSRCCGRA